MKFLSSELVITRTRALDYLTVSAAPRCSSAPITADQGERSRVTDGHVLFRWEQSMAPSAGDLALMRQLSWELGARCRSALWPRGR